MTRQEIEEAATECAQRHGFDYCMAYTAPGPRVCVCPELRAIILEDTERSYTPIIASASDRIKVKG